MIVTLFFLSQSCVALQAADGPKLPHMKIGVLAEGFDSHYDGHDGDGHDDDGHDGEHVEAIGGGREIKNSHDRSAPRLTFGGKGPQTVRIDFWMAPMETHNVDIYWYDDSSIGGKYRVPASWKITARLNSVDEGHIGPTNVRTVEGTTYGTKKDQYNHVKISCPLTGLIALEMKKEPGYGVGILQMKINGRFLDPHYIQGVFVEPNPDELGEGLDCKANVYNMVQMQATLYSASRTVADDPDTAFAGEIAARKKTLDAAIATKQWGKIGPLVKRDLLKAFLEKLDAAHGRDAFMKATIAADWAMQDVRRYATYDFGELAAKVRADNEKLTSQKSTVELNQKDPMANYLAACHQRRVARLKPHLSKLKELAYTQHPELGGSHYAYTERVTGSPSSLLPRNQYDERRPDGKSVCYIDGAALCYLKMGGKDGVYGTQEALVDEPRGMVRDPDVSYDGKRLLFSKRTSMYEDDFSLYEMELATRKIRALTNTPHVADYEAVYLPDGNIMFNSTRCTQVVDCAPADVSNFYVCDAHGKYIRRIGYDQVHTNYPQVLADGRVVYTRWDYNDRGQLFTQPLFQMNPDGTSQTEYYGNNSWYPCTLLHARGIPGTGKVLAIVAGHHVYQRGKLAMVDPTVGRQEGEGITMLAPVREPCKRTIDVGWVTDDQFTYPYPLAEGAFLVSYTPCGGNKQYGRWWVGRTKVTQYFGVYFMTNSGDRELLAADPTISSMQAVPIAPRPIPALKPSTVDYNQNSGTFFMQDVYEGPGLKGVKRGTIKALRVVALEFRVAAIGNNGIVGPGGTAGVHTPIAREGAWDVKRILGTAKVYEDGSAVFKVPALTPVYFQAIDENGYSVQSMRSWSTLQPGETFGCVGCHEDKNRTPTSASATMAMRAGPQELQRTYGPPRGFGFVEEIQPILDHHCVKCHGPKGVAKKEAPFRLDGEAIPSRSFGRHKGSGKGWSIAYRRLGTRNHVSWISPQSVPSMLPPYYAGAVHSPLIKMLKKGHNDVKLSKEELDKFILWIDLGIPAFGAYTGGMQPSQIEAYNAQQVIHDKHAAEDAKNRKALDRFRGHEPTLTH